MVKPFEAPLVHEQLMLSSTLLTVRIEVGGLGQVPATRVSAGVKSD
jgi:hypothetical protein